MPNVETIKKKVDVEERVIKISEQELKNVLLTTFDLMVKEINENVNRTASRIATSIIMGLFHEEVVKEIIAKKQAQMNNASKPAPEPTQASKNAKGNKRKK